MKAEISTILQQPTGHSSQLPLEWDWIIIFNEVVYTNAAFNLSISFTSLNVPMKQTMKEILMRICILAPST